MGQFPANCLEIDVDGKFLWQVGQYRNGYYFCVHKIFFIEFQHNPSTVENINWIRLEQLFFSWILPTLKYKFHFYPIVFAYIEI